MKKYTTRLVLKDGTQRMGEVVELTEEERDENAEALRQTMVDHDAFHYETRTGSTIIAPMESVSYIEVLEV